MLKALVIILSVNPFHLSFQKLFALSRIKIKFFFFFLGLEKLRVIHTTLTYEYMIKIEFHSLFGTHFRVDYSAKIKRINEEA